MFCVGETNYFMPLIILVLGISLMKWTVIL